MDTQKNLMLAFIALLTVASIWIVANHRVRMKELDVKLEESRVVRNEPKTKGMW